MSIDNRKWTPEERRKYAEGYTKVHHFGLGKDYWVPSNKMVYTPHKYTISIILTIVITWLIFVALDYFMWEGVYIFLPIGMFLIPKLDPVLAPYIITGLILGLPLMILIFATIVLTRSLRSKSAIAESKVNAEMIRIEKKKIPISKGDFVKRLQQQYGQRLRK